MMGMFSVSHGIKNVIREMIRQQVEAKQKSVLKYLSVRFSTVRQSRLHMDSEIQTNAHSTRFWLRALGCQLCTMAMCLLLWSFSQASYHGLLPCLWGVVCVGFWSDFAWLL